LNERDYRYPLESSEEMNEDETESSIYDLSAPPAIGETDHHIGS
jgi:hypothetical protein